MRQVNSVRMESALLRQICCLYHRYKYKKTSKKQKWRVLLKELIIWYVIMQISKTFDLIKGHQNLYSDPWTLWMCSPNEDKKNTLIFDLIKFIQKSAKHTGIESFSKIREITSGQLKRPKVWSQTRMVAYEYEMLERFLGKSIYLDIPLKYLLLA